MTRHVFLALFLSALSAATLGAQPALTGKEKAKARRDAMFAQVTDQPGLPRVLILGDSISMAYTPLVRTLLAGKANIHRPAENCFDSANGVKKLDTWLGDGKWDVVHFNFGLHDNKYLDDHGQIVAVEKGKLNITPVQYGENLKQIVARLKRTGAVLIFATTTPTPADSLGRKEASEIAYNDVARTLMTREGVAIDDLHAFLAEHPQPRVAPNNVHFLDEGSMALAKVVAVKIEAVLPKRK